VSFESFAVQAGPRLRAGLVAAYGPQVGLDAAADALAYAWEHWDRLEAMGNPVGYLYRVGQTSARNARRVGPLAPPADDVTMPDVEPALIPALNDLSESQRICVLLVVAFGWSRVETGELLGIDESTVRTHLRRGLARLQQTLEVTSDAR
jgi:DNA-directed RNA polymerase specialized sigma24 family protein